MVGVHRGANAGGIGLALVPPRPPFGFFTNEFVVNTATVDTDGQVVKHVILPPPPAVFAHEISMGPNLDLRFGSWAAYFKIRPDAVQFTHFELKLPSPAPSWAVKNLFFL